MIEKWKDIEGFVGKYQISNLGRVKSLTRNIKNGGVYKHGEFTLNGRIKKLLTRKDGYVVVTLSNCGKKTTKLVHRLVAEAFVPNFSSDPAVNQVNHVRGIKSDNRAKKLEWVTQSVNHKHAYKIGLKSQAGEKNAKAKLNRGQISVIRHLLKEKWCGITQVDIAKIFNVTPGTICHIKKGRQWQAL